MSDALRDLEGVLQARARDRPEGSYTVSLLDDGELLQRKIMEESFELCLELGRQPTVPGRISEEAADLVFHVLVGLTRAGVRLTDVERVLVSRKR